MHIAEYDKMNKLRLCAFADEASEYLKGQIEALKRNKISLIEIRTIDKENVADISEEKAYDVKKQLDEAGIKVWSVGSPIGKVDIDKDFSEEKNRFARLLKTASILGAENIRLFSFYKTSKEDKDEVISRLRTFVEMAKPYGIDLCHENEKGIFGDTIENCKIIHNSISELKMVFDPANFVQCNQVAYTAWDTLNGFVKYCHVKDALTDGRNVAAGEGNGNIPYMLRSYAEFGDVITLEPHLFDFYALSSLELEKSEKKTRFKDANEAFDFDVKCVRKILRELGVEER